MKKTILQQFSIFVICLILALPIISAEQLSIENINANVIDHETAEIKWETSTGSTSRVDYGIEELDQYKTDNNKVTEHKIKLSNLESDTEYKFQVQSTNSSSYTLIDNNSNNFYTLKTYPKLEFINISANTTDDSAVITWKTNIDTITEIHYSADKNNLEVIEVGDSSTQDHEINIIGLDPGTEYFFQIITEYTDSNKGGFKTLGDSAATLELEIPEFYNEKYMNIRGKTPAYAYVELIVNDDPNNRRYTPSSTSASGKFSFSNVELEQGNNKLKFTVTTKHGTEKEYIYNTKTDYTKPILDIETDIPETVEQVGSIEVKGYVNENVSIIYSNVQQTVDEASRVITGVRKHSDSKRAIKIIWNESKHPDFNYYKTYRNDKFFGIVKSAPEFVDRYINSGKTYKYQISMVDRYCNEGPLSNPYTYTTEPGDVEQEQDKRYYPEKCKISYQYAPIPAQGDFELNLPIEEGINYITIKAVDKAGNEDSKQYTIIKDTTAPDITNIQPSEAASGEYFIYEGTIGKDLIIEGYTDPSIQVKLYRKGKTSSITEVSSDESGYFKIEGINIEKYAQDFSNKPFLPTTPDRVDIAREEDTRNEIRDEEFAVNLYLVAIDKAGLKSQKKSLNFRIGTCWAGQMAFDIIPLAKYQAPTLLNPERIEQGTEHIQFLLNLSYFGSATDYQITDIRLDKRCSATDIEKDKRYNLSCKILPGSPEIIESNPDKTKWFIRYRLDSTEISEGDKKLKDMLLGNEMIFPYIVYVDFKENGETRGMKKCMDIAYTMDTKIDPRKVLPEWLLEGGIKTTNQTIEKLDKILPKIESALKILGVATLGAWIAKIGAKTYRKVTCRMESLTPETKCPKPGHKKNEGDEDLQDDLSDKDLDEKCSACAAAWEIERKAHETFRWAADRFLCHKTPAKWTEEASPEEVNQAIKESHACINNEKISTRGLIINLVPQPPEGSEKINFNSHYEFDGAHYVYEKSIGNNKYLLRKVYGGGTIGSAPAQLEVLKIGTTLLLEEDNIPGYIKSKMLKKDGETTYKLKEEPLPYALSQCTDMISEGKYIQEAAPNEKYSYREDKIGLTCYNENRYYEGRDQPACFGQDNALYRENLHMLTPQQHTSTFQCMCVSGIYTRLKTLKNIMQGLHNCFLQVKTSGRANTGICKEMFNNYMCSALWQVISYFTEDCTAEDGASSIGAGGFDGAKLTITSMFESLGESAEELQKEYGNVALDNYLAGGTQGIMRKICLGSLTGDWGLDFESIIDGSYSSTFNTVVGGYPAWREYLGYTPYNDKAMYEYRATWNIVPGCDVDGYSVDLVCPDDNTAMEQGLSCEKSLMSGETHPYQGCDCWTQETMTEPLAIGRRLSQGDFEDQSTSKIVESSNRYSHVRVKLHINNKKVAEQCLPEGHKDGVWYFPIEDKTARDIATCRFDPLAGRFVCEGTELLWDARGSAHFVNINEPISKEKAEYYPGDILKFNGDIYVKGDKTQCLWIEKKTSTGSKIGSPLVFKIKHNGTKNYDIVIDDNLQLTGATGVSFQQQVAPEGWQKELSYELISHNNQNTVQFEFTLLDTNNDQKITTYNVNGKYDQIKIGNGYAKNITGAIIESNGIKFKLNTMQMPYIVKNNKREYAKQLTYNVVALPSKPGEQEKEMKIHLELRHALDGTDNCIDSTAADQIRNDQLLWQKDIPIKIGIRPKVSPETDSCPSDSTYLHQTCICGGTSINCGDNTRGHYCYDGKCHMTEKCSIGEELSNPCVCASGKTEQLGGNGCDGEGKEYCCITDSEGEKTYGCSDDPCEQFQEQEEAEEQQQAQEATSGRTKKITVDVLRTSWYDIIPEGTIKYWWDFSSKNFKTNDDEVTGSFNNAIIQVLNVKNPKTCADFKTDLAEEIYASIKSYGYSIKISIEEGTEKEFTKGSDESKLKEFINQKINCKTKYS